MENYSQFVSINFNKIVIEKDRNNTTQHKKKIKSENVK